jgi:hypothetical protein
LLVVHFRDNEQAQANRNARLSTEDMPPPVSAIERPWKSFVDLSPHPSDQKFCVGVRSNYVVNEMFSAAIRNCARHRKGKSECGLKM